MKQKIIMLLLASMTLVSCCNTAEENPLLSDFKAPFGVPPFEEIELKHFEPAFEEAMRVHSQEIDVIANNTEEPTFDNTILALDMSGAKLAQLSSIFRTLSANMSNDELRELSKVITPLRTVHFNEINLNAKLFERVKALYDNKESLNLAVQEMRTLDMYYIDYVRRGANLNDAQKAELKTLSNELAMVDLQFNENLLMATNAYQLIVEDKADLAGLPESVIAAASADATSAGLDGKWLFTTHKPSLLPFLQYAENRDLRKQLYDAYYNRANGGEFDNNVIIKKIISLSSKIAKLKGYESHADYIISDNMAKTTDNVYDLMLQLWKPALKQAKVERKELQRLADADGVKIASWDWWYYTEKLRKEKFDLDENELRPYFLLDNVRDAMFEVANRMYGITFEERTDLPLYHPDVETFEVKDENGKHISLFYLDYHPRASKEGGAWCGSIRNYSYNNGQELLPIVAVSGNFTKPVGDTPSLLSWYETETLFHEFGHALEVFFARGKYSKVTGVRERDIVELPSQIMEHYISEKEVMNMYAKHYITGEMIPEALQEKLLKTLTFNQGWATTEHVAAALLDLDWYTEGVDSDLSVVEFEKRALDKYGLLEEIYPRYRSSFFGHVFGGGYSAGYYVYTWAAVLDSDAFQAFRESGDIFNKDVAAKFRKNILTEVGFSDGMTQYRKFRGKDPDVNALMKKRGFVE